jgi:hypothetical protein
MQVAPSGYWRHAAQRQNPALRSARAPHDDLLMPEIQRVWQANMQVYGADKVWRPLNREGIRVARCTVERLMKRLGLEGVRRGKVVRTTVPDHAVPCPLDRVNRQFKADRPNQLWVSEIVFTQMTKTDVLAARVGRDDITNFDLGIRHDNPVDQKLDQLTLLFEGGIDQPPLNAGAELLDGDGQSGHFLVAFGLGRELSLLFRQRLIPLRQVAAAPLILGQGDDGLQVGFREALQLLAQAGPPFLQVSPASLQLLG